MRKTGHAIKIKEMQAEIKRLEDERERIKKLDSLHDIACRAIAMAEIEQEIIGLKVEINHERMKGSEGNANEQRTVE